MNVELHLTSTLSYSLYVITTDTNKAIKHRFDKFQDVIKKNITRMHGSALRCNRSHSRSIWNMANLTPL